MAGAFLSRPKQISEIARTILTSLLNNQRKDMRKRLALISFLAVSILCATQQKPAAKPATQTAHATLPSEEEVNGFMRATFGYDPQLTWKIESIKPSKAEGLA